jgi:hypothetical protein
MVFFHLFRDNLFEKATLTATLTMGFMGVIYLRLGFIWIEMDRTMGFESP